MPLGPVEPADLKLFITALIVFWGERRGRIGERSHSTVCSVFCSIGRVVW